MAHLVMLVNGPEHGRIVEYSGPYYCVMAREPMPLAPLAPWTEADANTPVPHKRHLYKYTDKRGQPRYMYQGEE